MKSRILSTVALWVGLILLLIVFGAAGGAWLIAILAVLTQFELYGLLEKIGLRPHKRNGVMCGFVFLILTYYQPDAPLYDFPSAVMAILVVTLALLSMREAHRRYLNQTLFPTLAGFLLVPFMFSFLTRILNAYAQEDSATSGIFLCIWIIAVAKFADVGGLLAGKYFGKHKFAPRISPAKTWEGVIGGLFSSLLVGILLVALFRSYFPSHLSIWEAGLIALPIAGAGIMSDLLESVLKRQANVKDSGSIIPGIGGVFDLTDSLLFSIPVAYFLLQLT